MPRMVCAQDGMCPGQCVLRSVCTQDGTDAHLYSLPYLSLSHLTIHWLRSLSETSGCKASVSLSPEGQFSTLWSQRKGLNRGNPDLEQVSHILK